MFVMFVVPHLAGVLAWDQDEDVGLSLSGSGDLHYWKKAPNHDNSTDSTDSTGIKKMYQKNRENVEQMEEPGKGMQPAMANK